MRVAESPLDFVANPFSKPGIANHEDFNHNAVSFAPITYGNYDDFIGDGNPLSTDPSVMVGSANHPGKIMMADDTITALASPWKGMIKPVPHGSGVTCDECPYWIPP